MHATIWGCRGSLATPGEATLRYGGNTTSVEVRTDSGRLVVLDAGTGIRRLGISLADEAPRQIDLLLTHMHLDHVEGLGFFAPLFDPECTLTVWGSGPSLRERIAAYLSPPLFPLEHDRIPARIEVHEVGAETWSLDGLSVTAAHVQHPGGALGFRLEGGGRSLAFIPDNELGLDADSGLELAAGADVLLHDAQYTDEEYETRVGWGHTSLGQFAPFVQRAGAKRVVMFHHDPAHADAKLESMRDTACELAGTRVELAAEGLRL